MTTMMMTMKWKKHTMMMMMVMMKWKTPYSKHAHA